MNVEMFKLLWSKATSEERATVAEQLVASLLEERMTKVGLDGFTKRPDELWTAMAKVALEGMTLEPEDVEGSVLEPLNEWVAEFYTNEELMIEVVKPVDERGLLDFALQVCRVNVYANKTTENFAANVNKEVFVKIEASLTEKGVQLIESEEEFYSAFEKIQELSDRARFNQTPYCHGAITFEEFATGMSITSQLKEHGVFAQTLLKIYGRPVGKVLRIPFGVTEVSTEAAGDAKKLKELAEEGEKWFREALGVKPHQKVNPQITANATSFYCVLSPKIAEVCKAEVGELRKLQQRCVTTFNEVACDCEACNLQLELAKELGFEVEKKW